MQNLILLYFSLGGESSKTLTIKMVNFFIALGMSLLVGTTSSASQKGILKAKLKVNHAGPFVDELIYPDGRSVRMSDFKGVVTGVMFQSYAIRYCNSSYFRIFLADHLGRKLSEKTKLHLGSAKSWRSCHFRRSSGKCPTDNVTNTFEFLVSNNKVDLISFGLDGVVYVGSDKQIVVEMGGGKFAILEDVQVMVEYGEDSSAKRVNYRCLSDESIDTAIPSIIWSTKMKIELELTSERQSPILEATVVDPWSGYGYRRAYLTDFKAAGPKGRFEGANSLYFDVGDLLSCRGDLQSCSIKIKGNFDSLFKRPDLELPLVSRFNGMSYTCTREVIWE